jgi:hypothetical protein
MGITKGQLKSIVKECLIEILSEGMGSSTSESINEVKKKTYRDTTTSNSLAIQQNATRLKTQSSTLKEVIRLESGGNDIMASILADTAEKTLPSMLENDRMKTPKATGKIESIVASHDPQELFGEEAASKWANLAFPRLSNK